jgi:hypothetical protein
MSSGKKKNRLPPFVAITREMLKSEAWESLTNAARVAYIHLQSKCVSFDQKEVTLSFKEMERIMSRHTYAGAIDQLEECGFIIKAQRGGLFRKRNFYHFIDEWKSYKKKTGVKINSSAVSAPSVVQF